MDHSTIADEHPKANPVTASSVHISAEKDTEVEITGSQFVEQTDASNVLAKIIADVKPASSITSLVFLKGLKTRNCRKEKDRNKGEKVGRGGFCKFSISYRENTVAGSAVCVAARGPRHPSALRAP